MIRWAELLGCSRVSGTLDSGSGEACQVYLLPLNGEHLPTLMWSHQDTLGHIYVALLEKQQGGPKNKETRTGVTVASQTPASKKRPATGYTAWICARNANRRLLSPTSPFSEIHFVNQREQEKAPGAQLSGLWRKWKCREHSADGAEAKAG